MSRRNGCYAFLKPRNDDHSYKNRRNKLKANRSVITSFDLRMEYSLSLRIESVQYYTYALKLISGA